MLTVVRLQVNRYFSTFSDFSSGENVVICKIQDIYLIYKKARYFLYLGVKTRRMIPGLECLQSQEMVTH